MESLLGGILDQRNIGLVKILYALRQDLDIFCLISANGDKLNKGSGKAFFGHLQQLTLGQIALSLCKIYEEEKGYELNSIDGVIRQLSKENNIKLDSEKLKDFLIRYKGPIKEKNQISALQSATLTFRKGFQDELNNFKIFRDKIIAHTEYGIVIDPHLPSFDTMEKLFFFGADFYELVSSVFLVVSPVPVKEDRKIKISLMNVFKKMGLLEIKDDME